MGLAEYLTPASARAMWSLLLSPRALYSRREREARYQRRGGHVGIAGLEGHPRYVPTHLLCDARFQHSICC